MTIPVRRVPAPFAWALALAAALALGGPGLLRARAAEPKGAPAASSPTKAILAEELASVERDLAARMMRRADPALAADQRTRLEMEIDLRIVQRAVLRLAIDAKPEAPDQSNLFLRCRQLHGAVRGLEDAIAQAPSWSPNASQKEALGLLRKLSYTVAEIKPAASLDEYCRALALTLGGVVNSTPIDAKALPLMRPTPLAGPAHQPPPAPSDDRPPTVAELQGQVQRLATISVALRQQLLFLAAAANEKEDPALYGVLVQSVSLARGLQSNTAVGADARAQIEAQLAEGIALYVDTRTRDAGKARIESLGQYRKILTQIGKLSLTREQMDLLGPALAWAQAHGEAGSRLLDTVSDYVATGARFDARLKDAAALAALKRPLEDVAAQFAKRRRDFLTDASRIGSGSAALGAGPADLEQHAAEMRRLYDLADDLLAMGPALDALNAYKLKPAGALDRKVQFAATAAASPTKNPVRADADRYLNAVRRLADLSQALSAHPLTEVPPPVAATWAGGKVEAFEARWRTIVADQATALIGPATDLDKARVARLEAALALGDALRNAVKLDAALAKAPVLARWADWGIDPASLGLVVGQYRDALAAAFTAYAADAPDTALDRFTRVHHKYVPLAALLVRDAPYADQCQNFPIGLAGDLARLATPLDNQPFTTERFASGALTAWAALERAGDYDNADKVALTLSRRLARDLRLEDRPNRRR